MNTSPQNSDLPKIALGSHADDYVVKPFSLPELLARSESVPRQVDNDHIAMITAANTPHTITNALMICFSSETDIGQTDSARSPTTPVIAGVVALMGVRCVRGG